MCSASRAASAGGGVGFSSILDAVFAVGDGRAGFRAAGAGLPSVAPATVKRIGAAAIAARLRNFRVRIGGSLWLPVWITALFEHTKLVICGPPTSVGALRTAKALPCEAQPNRLMFWAS